MKTVPGRVLAGRYRIDGPVGSGGMAIVHAGVDTRLGRPVAIKCLRPELSDPRARRRFELEGRMAARLNHPNIVAVHDAGEDGSCAFMVMELLSGRTLADEMAAGPMTSARADDVCRQVLSALAAAHRAGVVHRDIKPSNLLIGADDTVKVADFGIATSLRSAADLTRTGELIGTASYIAPERLAGANASAASDLYSLGAVLYEALTGARMYSADNTMAYVRQVMDSAPVPVATAAPGTDPALAAVVDQVLAKDPARRFATAEAMAAALDAAPDGPLDHVPAAPTVDPTVGWGAPLAAPGAGSAPTEVLISPARAPIDRRWWAAAGAAGAILILIVVALATAGGGSGSGSTVTPPPAAPLTTTLATTTTVTTTTTTTTVPKPHGHGPAPAPAPGPGGDQGGGGDH